MKVENTNIKTFKSLPMPLLTKGLYALGNNDMLNAAAIDVFAMDTPRTIVETKHRGKNAGIEMGFREYTGTFIAEFSAALFAVINSKIMSKLYKPDVKVNASSWATNNAIDVYNEIYKVSNKTPEDFLKNVLSRMSGLVGKNVKSFSDICESKSEEIIKSLSEVIKNPQLDKKQVNTKLLEIQDKIIENLGADNSIRVSINGKSVESNLSHALRDIIDLAKNVFFTNNGTNTNEIISKLKKINNSRILYSIPLSMLIAITNQYINRQLTKKRTGIDNFVGENGYENNVANKNQSKKEKGLLAKKTISAGIFLFMLSKVMGITKPSDLITKLEFNGPATSGNAIKTIYGTLILGRMFASKDSTELRETNIRDYLGFLNWLVLGGFVSKGVAKIIDPKENILFNVSKQGNGISHFLKDISLKSQKEIIAQGGNIKKNLRNLNFAQLSGIAYSAIMLGILLPKLNIFMTRHSGKRNDDKNVKNNIYNFIKDATFDEFEKEVISNNH